MILPDIAGAREGPGPDRDPTAHPGRHLRYSEQLPTAVING